MSSLRGHARPWAWLLIGCAPLSGIVACGSKGPSAAPSDPIACEDAGPTCGSGAGSGSTPPKDAASVDADSSDDVADAQIATATVSVSVIQFQDSEFSDSHSVAFTGVGIVGVPVATGQQDYPIGGDAAVEFEAANVLVGPGWYQVRPTGSPELMATHVFLSLAADQTQLALPVIDRGVLSTTYLQAAQASPLDPLAGQIIVRFFNTLGSPASGVKITFCPFTGLTSARLFDTGPSSSFVIDTDGKTTTGANGTVIITNVTENIGSLTYDYKGVERKTPTIAWVKPQATFARITIPD